MFCGGSTVKRFSDSDGCYSLDQPAVHPSGNDLLCRSSVVTVRSWRSQPVPSGVPGIFCRQRWFSRYARSECRWHFSF
jgi:hypothetical protein